MEVGERPGQVVDRGEAEVLDRARGRLDGRGRQRRLVVGREDGAVHARGLGRPEQRADVLGILERVEHQHERRLGALGGEREDLVGRRPRARADDQGDPLVPVEAGDRRQGPALELDDRDPQAGRVEHELLERVAPLRDDEQAPAPRGGRRTPPRRGAVRRRSPRPPRASRRAAAARRDGAAGPNRRSGGPNPRSNGRGGRSKARGVRSNGRGRRSNGATAVDSAADSSGIPRVRAGRSGPPVAGSGRTLPVAGRARTDTCPGRPDRPERPGPPRPPGPPGAPPGRYPPGPPGRYGPGRPGPPPGRGSGWPPP